MIYSSENPKWSKYNAPYFNEFKFIDLETFLLKNHHEYYLSERVLGIFFNNKPVGIVTYYWENFATRWLEIGIIIYDNCIWSKGIGLTALNKWIKICFDKFPEIQHIGLTTWSGNLGIDIFLYTPYPRMCLKLLVSLTFYSRIFP